MAEPIASTDTYTVTAGNIDLLASFVQVWVFTFDQTILSNDTDADGDALSVISVDGQSVNSGESVTVQGSSGGFFTISSNGEFTFDGTEGFQYLAAGETVDTIVTYTISDGNGGTSTAQIVVTVEGVDGDEISAGNDLLTTLQDDAITSSAGFLLDNDTTSNGDTLSITQVNNNASFVGTTVAGDNGGLFTIDAAGNVTFDPAEEFTFLGEGEVLTTSVTYTVLSSNGSSTTATASVEVTGVNDAPTLQGEVYSSFRYWDSLANELGYNVIEAGDSGVLEGVVRVGDFEFDRGLLKNDTDIDKAPSEIFIEGREIGEASNGSLTITEANGVQLVDGEAIVSGTNGGTFTIGERGELSFETGSDFDDLYIDQSRTTTIVYTVSDEYGATETATAEVSVQGTKPYVVAVSDAFTADEDSVLGSGLGEVVANDFSDGGLTLGVEGVYRRESYEAYSSFTKKFETYYYYDKYLPGESVVGQNGGLFTILADGTLSFDPNGEFDGLKVGETASTGIYYRVEDGSGFTSRAYISVQVEGRNDAPVGVDDAYEVDAGTVTEVGGTQVISGVTYQKQLVANDTDADGDVLTVESVEGVALNGGDVTVLGDNGGQFTVSVDGTVTFDAATGEFDALAEGESTVTQITYTVTDGQGGTDTATATVTVNGVNDAPDAVADNLGIVAVGGSLTFNIDDLLTNDTDVDNGAVLTFEAFVNGAKGTITDNGDGTATWDTNGEFAGLADGQTEVVTFGYTIKDELDEISAEGSVSLTVVGGNIDPVGADDDYYTIDAGQNQQIAGVINVGSFTYDQRLLSNDMDANNDALSVVSVGGQALVGGTVTVAGDNGGDFTVFTDGTVTFDAATGDFDALLIGETAISSVQYTVSDGQGGTDVATISVEVAGQNTQPDALDDNTGNVVAGDPLTFNIADLLVNDSDADAGSTVSFGSFIQGSEGNVVDNGDGTATWTPTNLYEELDSGESVSLSFQYTVVDEFGAESDPATVRFRVEGASDPVEAMDDQVSVVENPGLSTYVDIFPLANDEDKDASDSLSIISIDTAGLKGTLFDYGDNFSYNPNGEFEYLEEGETETTSFTYTVESSDGSQDTATVDIVVTGQNDAPDAQNDVAGTINEDQTLTFNIADLLANDSDIDNNSSFSFVSFTDTFANGVVTDNNDGTLTYDPNGAYDYLDSSNPTEIDQFTYTIEDEYGAQENGVVSIFINGVDDPITP